MSDYAIQAGGHGVLKCIFLSVCCVQFASLMGSLMNIGGHRYICNFKAVFLLCTKKASAPHCGQSALVCHFQYVPTQRPGRQLPTSENWQTITYTNSLRAGSSNLSPH